MPQIFELRRHSLRGDGKSLSPEGIELARRTAPRLVGDFDAFYSSPKPRAVETLQAFGFGACTEVPEFSTLPGRLAAFDSQVADLCERTGCSVLEAYLAIPEANAIVRAFGKAAFGKVRELAAQLAPGRNALAVSHGGTIEPTVLAAMPGWTLEDMGGELAECEGALFHFDGPAFSYVEIPRL